MGFGCILREARWVLLAGCSSYGLLLCLCCCCEQRQAPISSNQCAMTHWPTRTASPGVCENRLLLCCLQEIQQLPYQHIIKWLPSKLRSKDPGPDDCLDVQVETTAGRKDLRMRCDSAQMVQTVITEIRSTVQVGWEGVSTGVCCMHAFPAPCWHTQTHISVTWTSSAALLHVISS